MAHMDFLQISIVSAEPALSQPTLLNHVGFRVYRVSSDMLCSIAGPPKRQA